MLLVAVQSLSGCLAAHALNAMGKTPRDVGYSNWLGDGPLAGWGSLPLDYFSPPTVAERERTAEAVAAMRLFLGNVLSPAVLDRIESAWHHTSRPKTTSRPSTPFCKHLRLGEHCCRTITRTSLQQASRPYGTNRVRPPALHSPACPCPCRGKSGC